MAEYTSIGKLGIIMMVITNMERSVAFYRDVLGLKLLFKQSNWSQFDAGSLILGLHPEGEEVKVGPTTGCTFGIYVNDIRKATSEMKRRGGNIEIEPRREPFGLWALLRDPDGYGIQIIQMASSVNSGENIT
ncbi:MAG TPA: VOC family protein [Clostridia bacterium]|nr:VOC family protein [Clostridia bacterium]